MNKCIALLASCVALGLVAAGCGSDDEKDSGSAETTEQPAEQPAEKPAGEGTVSVSMKNTLFVPMDVTVKAGGTVTWKNDDSFAHTVTKGSGPGPQFDSKQVDGGGTFEQKFAKPGKIDYLCTIHPTQTGSITVE